MPQYDIEIRNTNVASDLSDCVIVLDFAKASADCQAWLYANAKSDGTDIRVYLSDGVTQLNHDLISFSKPGTDQVAGYMRILVPNVDSSANTPLRLDCDGARSDGSTTATYPANYRCYLTLDEDAGGSAPQFIDRTAYGNNATANSMSGNISGKIGNGVATFGSPDYVNAGFCGMTNSDAFVVSFWTNASQFGGVGRGLYNVWNVACFALPTGYYFYVVTGSASECNLVVAESLSGWVKFTGSWNPSVAAQMFGNGVLLATSNSPGSVLRSSPFGWILGRTADHYYIAEFDDFLLRSGTTSQALEAFLFANESSSDNEIDYIGEVSVATAKPWLYRRGSQMIGGGIL